MATTRMLAGYRVLDLSQYLAGAGITRHLAEMGPEIIKVELAPGGDPSRLLAWIVDGRSTVFVQTNRGKQSICLDWDTEEGRRIITELVPHCDVVVENFAQGVLERRGLHYEALRELKPDLVMISISAYGQDSPWADRPGFDGVIQATSGLMHMTGDPDGPPSSVGFAIADNTTAVHGFAALGYALLHRERTGEGQHVDIAMADVMFHLQDQLAQASASGGRFRPNRVGRHHPLYCPVGTYDLPSGGYAFMLVLDRQWPYLVEALGRPDLLDDERYATSQARAENQATLIPIVQEWMLSFPDDEAVLDACVEHRVPLGKVLDPLDAVGHPHYEARGMVRRIKDPILGEMLMPGNPFRFSAQQGQVDLVAPLLGQHNREVLTRVLGYDDATIDALERGGVLHSSPR